MNKVSAIILAAGSGTRFGEKKQFKKLNGKPIWTYSLKAFVKSKYVGEVVLVIPQEFLSEIESSLTIKKLSNQIDIKIVKGGKSRQNSVVNGLNVVKNKYNLVCIHDAARPFVRSSYIKKTIEACTEFDSSIVAVAATDTIKKVENETVKKTIDRNYIWMAQTPQTFQKEKLLKAFKLFSHVNITDESMIMELAGFSTKIIEGDANNLKITKALDWELAKLIEGKI